MERTSFFCRDCNFCFYLDYSVPKFYQNLQTNKKHVTKICEKLLVQLLKILKNKTSMIQKKKWDKHYSMDFLSKKPKKTQFSKIFSMFQIIFCILFTLFQCFPLKHGTLKISFQCFVIQLANPVFCYSSCIFLRSYDVIF